MSEEKESTSALARYWKIYGGAGAVFKSRYFWCAFLMTVILYPSWSHQGWWNDIRKRRLSTVWQILKFLRE
ncbi:hypothetical protein [Salmonella enterica]|uniref:hypothetical protein n=1 Tax=Salmonella enterica TaxID=28901 RepID=UPI0015C4DE7E|nr:hypothetical protein [Salmonella enterica]